jgi:drug/metabolite transporter (DMT)-like permease
MPLSALLLVLCAAVAHSFWNVLLKRDTRRLEIQSGALVLTSIAAAPILVFYPLETVTAQGWLLIALSSVFESAYAFSLAAAYAAGEMSLVYPIARGTSPLIVTPLALLVFGERLSATGVFGIVLVVAGIYASHAEAARGAMGAAHARRAVAFALLTGVVTAGYSLVNRAGVRAVPLLLYAYLVFVLDAALVLAARRVRGDTAWPLGRALPWRTMLVVTVLMAASYLAVLSAMKIAPVGYVVAARESSILVTLVVSVLFLREPLSVGRVAGGLAIFAGLVVIALSR